MKIFDLKTIPEFETVPSLNPTRPAEIEYAGTDMSLSSTSKVVLLTEILLRNYILNCTVIYSKHC